MSYIKRTIEDEILRATEYSPVVMVYGPIRAGKTTMLVHIMEKEREYITFLDPEVRKFAKEDPLMFFEKHKPPIFIDDFHLVPSILPTIQYVVDEKMSLEKENNGMIWLAGSQNFIMMKNVTEHLAGRVAMFDLSFLSER